MTSASTLLSLAEAASVVILGAGSTFFAKKASDRSKPTSNGFAQHMIDGLRELREQNVRIEGKLDGHIRDHWLSKDDGK